MSQPQLGPLAPLDKKKPFAGLTAWQKGLAVLPLLLVAVGGLIGGVLGALAMLTNVKIARSQVSTPVKAMAMLGVTAAALVVLLVTAAALSTALNG
ncbi:hypothetical protein ABZV60_17975 [Streptomyces sp. NPDC004787]|uniref:hypothetical protein n=1 Tax=Streptomyces sp. NPDC004787 TaxID=3154291 RepID=UPI0033BAB8A6